MAKISNEAIELGRNIIWDKDLENLELWFKLNAPSVDWVAGPRDTYTLLFSTNNVEKAIMLFDRTMIDYDQEPVFWSRVLSFLTQSGCFLFIVAFVLTMSICLISKMMP